MMGSLSPTKVCTSVMMPDTKKMVQITLARSAGAGIAGSGGGWVGEGWAQVAWLLVEALAVMGCPCWWA